MAIEKWLAVISVALFAMFAAEMIEYFSIYAFLHPVRRRRREELSKFQQLISDLRSFHASWDDVNTKVIPVRPLLDFITFQSMLRKSIKVF